MLEMILPKAIEKTSAPALRAAFRTSLWVRVVLFCLLTISASRGCRNVPGDGFASTGFVAVGVEGAVRATEDVTVERALCAEGGRRAVEDIVASEGHCLSVRWRAECKAKGCRTDRDCVDVTS
jgi:hypothetical protein